MKERPVEITLLFNLLFPVVHRHKTEIVSEERRNSLTSLSVKTVDFCVIHGYENVKAIGA
jgi:hypothetical protein